MRVIGVDIGTTTISLVVLDMDSAEQLACLNLENPGLYPGSYDYESLQDPERILACVHESIRRLKAAHGPIDAIGIDGQMHGVLYVDDGGNAVSPLYTWQDGHGRLDAGGETMSEALSRTTGYPMASGYALTTHYALSRLGGVPERAACICTIGDYAAMKLAGMTRPVCHVSNAASMGLFDSRKGDWDRQAMARAGLSGDILPEIAHACRILGVDADGTRIACAIGDNQASFLGAVREENGSLLINVGTGGQASMRGKALRTPAHCEERPLDGKRTLLVGSSLCGGRAYALLHRFVLGCAQMAGTQAESVYEQMNAAALEVQERPTLHVDTRFCGSRTEPQARGCIWSIDEHNFDIAHFASGVLWGMADELYEFYQDMLASGAKPARVMVGSGNGIRKNPALRSILKKRFGMELLIPAHVEEAAYGAALCAAQALDGGQRGDYASRMIRCVRA